MRRLFSCCLFLLCLCSWTQAGLGAALPVTDPVELPGAQRCVLLLHGLARTWRSMRPVGDALSAAGWQVVNRGYPSRSASVELLSKHVGLGFEACRERVVSDAQIDVVTHSMGGILLRQWVKDTNTQFGRAVMLGPPNRGSEIVDRIGGTVAFRVVNGPAGVQLGTGNNALWRRLPDVPFELGVIAGRGEERGFLGRHVAAPNDGKVSVASTRVGGMRDHLTLEVGHTFMMNKVIVHEQIQSFLRRGQFSLKMPDDDKPL